MRTWQEDGHRVVKLDFISLKFEKLLLSDFIRDSPANLNSGGAYDMVCCAVVGLMLPGLEAKWKKCQMEDYQRKKGHVYIFRSYRMARRLLYYAPNF